MSNKEEDEIDFNLIINKFNIKKNNDIEQILTKDNKFEDDSLKIPLIYDSYYTIFKYLDDNEILKFSSLNKLNGVCVLYYWLNYLENKIIYLNKNYKKLSDKYNSLNEKLNTVKSKSNSILSYFSKSGLRVISSPHYLDIYNNPVENFLKDKIIIFIYKMLFHFNKLYDYEKNNISDNDFILLIQKEIKKKTFIKKSLKEYVSNLLDKEMNFTFENVMIAKKIMKDYNIQSIEGNQLAKIDRATTIIGYVIKDIMGFTGIIIKDSVTINNYKNAKKNEVDISFSSMKNKIIKVCEEIDKEKSKCENVIKKIKDLIVKYYNN